jgi:hypothetical protein
MSTLPNVVHKEQRETRFTATSFDREKTINSGHQHTQKLHLVEQREISLCIMKYKVDVVRRLDIPHRHIQHHESSKQSDPIFQKD